MPRADKLEIADLRPLQDPVASVWENAIVLGPEGVWESVKGTKAMFHAYSNALDLIRALVPVVEQLKTYDANIADQVTRAATSITLNVAEGNKRSGKDRRRFFVMAQGSAGEIRGALDTADAWGWRVETSRARALLDRELALLWGLCKLHP